ncbi:pro-FMRFamide-related neuropeptide VF isoform X3 [Takifugu rubripes]|uniref:pro-FMRFamide-related neuropeptide VF isoform X3 n=1 Tax=Takifugu rubripes TaxID=31033 RepID=UPI0011452EC4|nr:RFamide-related peptide isoform X3 [Takifugu rubripes]
MLVTAFLAMLLMIAGIGGAAETDLQVNGKLNDRTLSSREGRHNVRKQLRHQIKSNILRSLDMERINIQHVNMPMRFGRDGVQGGDHVPNLNPKMPQRFGRSWKVIRLCEDCSKVQGVLKHQVRYDRNGQSLIRTLVNAQLLKTGLHWT